MSESCSDTPAVQPISLRLDYMYMRLFWIGYMQSKSRLLSFVSIDFISRLHKLTVPDGGLDGRRVHQGGRDAVELLRQAGNEQGRVRIIDYVGHHGMSGVIMYCGLC